MKLVLLIIYVKHRFFNCSKNRYIYKNTNFIKADFNLYLKLKFWGKVLCINNPQKDLYGTTTYQRQNKAMEI